MFRKYPIYYNIGQCLKFLVGKHQKQTNLNDVFIQKVLGGNIDDDAIFEELARKQGKSRFETPVNTETMCSRITVPFASSKKTPVSNINVEMLEGRYDNF